MTSKLRTVKAGCLCGRGKHEITLQQDAFPMPTNICHCDSCRHMTGQFGLFTAHLPSDYQPDQALLDKLSIFDFSKNIRHYFCPTCGCNILATATDGGSHVWLVPIGTLEEGDSSVYTINGHIFVEDTQDGGFADFLTHIDGKPIKRFARYFDSPELPLYWDAPDRPQVRTPKVGERLHGWCKCRGVEFWLTAPSDRSVFAKQAYEKGEIPSDQPIPDPQSPDEVWWLRDNRTRFRAAICPCDSCRVAANGQAFGVWAYVATVDVSLDAEGKVPVPESLQWGTLKSWSTKNATQHFCGTCGAVVFWNTKARPELQDYGIGLFESADGARAESWFRWRTAELRHREDGLRRAPQLTLAVEEGLREYKNNVQSKLSGHDPRAEEGFR